MRKRIDREPPVSEEFSPLVRVLAAFAAMMTMRIVLILYAWLRIWLIVQGGWYLLGVVAMICLPAAIVSIAIEDSK